MHEKIKITYDENFSEKKNSLSISSAKGGGGTWRPRNSTTAWP